MDMNDSSSVIILMIFVWLVNKIGEKSHGPKAYGKTFALDQ